MHQLALKNPAYNQVKPDLPWDNLSSTPLSSDIPDEDITFKDDVDYNKDVSKKHYICNHYSMLGRAFIK